MKLRPFPFIVFKPMEELKNLIMNQYTSGRWMYNETTTIRTPFSKWPSRTGPSEKFEHPRTAPAEILDTRSYKLEIKKNNHPGDLQARPSHLP